MEYLKSLFILLLFSSSCLSEPPYRPDWSSLDKRPLPLWFDDAKFGIFVHWGVYSVPSFGSEWFWWYWKGSPPYQNYVDYMKKNFKPNFTYADFAPMFTADLFSPAEWADLFYKAGIKYVVSTSKHHEGFTMWPSAYSWNWNSVDVGPHKDLVGDLAFHVRQKRLTFGLYFSQFEWFNPLFNADAANHYNTTLYPTTVSVPQMYELVTKYKPEVFWSDGDAGPDTYWKSKEFIAWLYNDSPVKDTVVTNDRWGDGVMCKHGDFYTCQDRYNPGKLQNHKWENCMTIQRNSWGFDRTSYLKDYLSTKELLNSLVSTVSCGGNLLLNVGPTHDGRIVPIFQERLLEMGGWLKINGQSIYKSKPWLYQNDTTTPNVWYTSKLRSTRNLLNLNSRRIRNPQLQNTTVIYATFFDWPQNGKLRLGAPVSTDQTTVRLLGVDVKLPWKPIAIDDNESGIEIDLTVISFQKMPSFIAWTLKIEYLKSESEF